MLVCGQEARKLEKSDAVQSPEWSKEQYEFLKQQNKDFRAFVEKERHEHRQFLEDTYKKIIWFFGTIAVVLLALIGFMGWRTRREVKSSFKRYFEQQGNALIEEKHREIDQLLSILREEVDRETAYLSKSILFVIPEADVNKFESRELAVLRARGIQKLQVRSNIDNIMQAVAGGAFDTIVYWYNPTSQEEGDANLQRLIDVLCLRNSTIPLIIYTFEKGEGNRLHSIDQQKTTEYSYSLLANFPITLVNHIFTTINYFVTDSSGGNIL